MKGFWFSWVDNFNIIIGHLLQIKALQHDPKHAILYLALPADISSSSLHLLLFFLFFFYCFMFAPIFYSDTYCFLLLSVQSASIIIFNLFYLLRCSILWSMSTTFYLFVLLFPLRYVFFFFSFCFQRFLLIAMLHTCTS